MSRRAWVLPNSHKYKILVVEDDTNIRNLVAAILKSADYQVILAESCSAAKTVYSSYMPDLADLKFCLCLSFLIGGRGKKFNFISF